MRRSLAVPVFALLLIASACHAPAPAATAPVPSNSAADNPAPSAVAADTGHRRIFVYPEHPRPAGAKPLLVVDDSIWSMESPNDSAEQWEKMSSLQPSEIDRVDVLKPPAAMQRFGAHGRFGAILITTKHAARSRTPTTAPDSAAPLPVLSRPSDPRPFSRHS